MKTRILMTGLGIALCLFTLPGTFAIACTIVSGADKNGTPWAGNNEDMIFHPNTQIRVLPRESERLGIMLVTYANGFPQGGVNEVGLFFDGNALKSVSPEGIADWQQKSDMPTDQVGAFIDLLRTASTVPEVLRFFETHRWEALLAAQLHFADALGNRAVISADGVCSHAADKSYLVSTNFRVCTNLERGLGDGKNWRYPAVRDLFEDRGLSFETVRDALAATNQPYVSTIYSFVVNLATLDLSFYYGGNFEQSIDFNVGEMIAEGRQTILMREMFADSLLGGVWNRYFETGGEAALELYRQQSKGMASGTVLRNLRHIYTALLFDPQGQVDIAAARLIYREWRAVGGENGSEDFFDGLFALTQGDVDSARRLLDTKNSDHDFSAHGRKLLDRLNGKITEGDLLIELDGYRDADFVYVKEQSLLAVLNRNNKGWNGVFRGDPKQTFTLMVDGKAVKPSRVLALN